MDKSGGGNHDFPSKLFFLCTEENCKRALLTFRKLRVLKKYMDMQGEGLSWIHPKFFVSQCRTTSKVNPLVCHYFRVSKNITNKREGRNHFFPSKLIFPTDKYFRRGTLLCFWKIGITKNLMPKRRTSRFSIENLLSRINDKHRRWNPSVL